MAKFIVQQHRKPWNKGAEWIYQKASYLASYAEAEKIETMQQFHDRLKEEWAFECKRYHNLNKMADGIDISTWGPIGPNVQYNTVKFFLGINKKHSTQVSALVVIMEKEVTNG